jgi:hypothetical protein
MGIEFGIKARIANGTWRYPCHCDWDGSGITDRNIQERTGYLDMNGNGADGGIDAVTLFGMAETRPLMVKSVQRSKQINE